MDERRERNYYRVLRRDKNSCVLCGVHDVHVHEIIPRSKFGQRRKHICFSEKNMVTLCVKHHEVAHNRKMRTELLGLLSDRYGYTYEEEEFLGYIQGGIDES